MISAFVFRDYAREEYLAQPCLSRLSTIWKRGTTIECWSVSRLFCNRCGWPEFWERLWGLAAETRLPHVILCC